MSLRVMRIVIQKVEIPGSWLMMLIKEDILYMNLYYIYIYIMIVLLIVLIVFVFFPSFIYESMLCHMSWG